ncbi:MAG: PH domain-containing protein [Alphaproteobacteria bacterium]|nr:PH domain-containing protein [Alphaproteobacteria bacterium]
MPHDDFTVEPIEGLPETPPAGELILWQGKPNALALARDALNLYWVAGYFALLAFWRVGVSSADMSFAQALPLGLPFIVLGVLACAVLYGIAYVLARTTMYTVTTARVAMRVGAALTVTLNLPFPKIGAAHLTTRKDGTGSIVFETMGETRLSYLVLWPHVRPWRIKKTQPALRSIPDAAKVAQIVAEAAETRVSQPEISRELPDGAVVAAE